VEKNSLVTFHDSSCGHVLLAVVQLNIVASGYSGPRPLTSISLTV